MLVFENSEQCLNNSQLSFGKSSLFFTEKSSGSNIFNMQPRIYFPIMRITTFPFL